MNSLSAITGREEIRIPDCPFDHFQSQLLGNLHLEFFLQKCRVLITPHLSYLTTGEAAPDEKLQLDSILQERAGTLEDAKRYLIYNLSLYSALLESNSYLLTVNNHLLISRFVARGECPDVFEVKLYTHSQRDLVSHYTDKIYVGRDCLSFQTLQRDHFGLRCLRDSLQDQVTKLRLRLARLLPPDQQAQVERELIAELQGLADEFRDGAAAVVRDYPPQISSATLAQRQLLDVNRLFRDLKHVLVEMDETLREWEDRLLKSHEGHAARYVTKLRKDVDNDVNYILLKVNGRISDSVNGFHV